jgi:subtilisin family serine protease
MKFLSLSLIFLFFYSGSHSQSVHSRKNGWHLLDPSNDGYMGISVDKAYDLLRDRKASTVIVAVIDSGIDTLQEDLRPVLWRNPKEINGNGKDDDGNGYTDDIYGWNFCGAPNGENLQRNSHEIERVYHKWKTEFEGKKETDIPAEKKFLYQQWVKAADLINKDYEEAKKSQEDVKNFVTTAEISSKILCDALKVKEFTSDDIAPLVSKKDKKIAASAEIWKDIFSRGDATTKNTQVLEEVNTYLNDIYKKIDLKLNAPEDLRGKLVKDNYLDINDRFYGNNNLKSGSGDHGTLVAGTIAAVRHNGIGIDGIADHVQIMAIRAVPGGDEHDKDVALAIRYAVDNGASIINMSFGKPVSPYKQFVDDAVKYAASKGVLLVHGSGNDGMDITKDIFYPNPVYMDGSRATNYITVGASGDESTGGYAADFSNYSSKWVDLFAPGMNIYSTATDNRYVGADGTSLACPVVSGVAALLKSYFPSLTPEQMITILTTSGKTINEKVQQPGKENKMVPFSSLSSSGKIVNAYEAVKLVMEWEKEKKKTF